ncbi:nitrate reductase subunit beta [Cryobacterium melibiosiphilum]|uniref:Nitrate reductase subunit beta n=1 Tax=Cryobacterium melibiosiphilum TaxID=995039 RepID=A0A3A5MXW2_9MICO|nr:nitrate reductase subunit beta [Cryobacterium melibiosiphilum]RJT90866.1 nitrate reductase subunit beta [Cryobacterium melibiosiphilum]
MRVMAQMSMIMNLDKCIGCHTCSVTCKQVWTNREGVEYAWFNNVETRPGLGYPRQYEDQERWKGGWVRNKRGRLKLKGGGRLNKLAHIFNNPDLPGIDDYYEPWTYDYDMLTTAPAGTQSPVARPKSLLTGRNMDIKWSGNWDDDLGGSQETAAQDPILATMSEKVKMEFEETFMFYLPRICEHCLNPACVSACPSGAMYKREEDGIVLVDEDGCRGWRMCVSACPYKKVYFNHKTGKAEKCTLCYPLIEQGKPTICSETCVGRLRYLGLMLYDADAVLEAASVENDQDLLEAQRSCFLDPFDPEVIAAAKAEGMADDWIEAAQKSPIRKLITEYKVALPLHPEYRTMPMVWYIPPLSPVVDVVSNSGADGEDTRTLFAAIDKLRIPVEYLAGLFSAGDVKPVESSLRKLAAMRSFMRDINLGRDENASIPESVGMTATEMKAMYRLLAIAKYEDRYVIPKAHVETARELDELGCSLDNEGGPGMGGPSSHAGPHNGGRDQGPAGPYGNTPGMPLNATVDNYNEMVGDSPIIKTRPATPGRINLLNWNGTGGAPEGMFPPKLGGVSPA